MLRPFRVHRNLDPDLGAPILAALSASLFVDTFGPTPEENHRETYGDLTSFRDRVNHRIDASHRLDAVLDAAWAEQARRNSSRSRQ